MEGQLCAACFEGKTLKRATARCRDCRESLCDECSTQHREKKHFLESLAEKNCDKHQQKLLELYCFDCRTNICITCVSESHQGHKCDSIRKLAEDLTGKLKGDVEELTSCGSRLRKVVDVLLTQKQTYESYFFNMDERVKAEIHGQQYRADLEMLTLEKRRRAMEGFVERKLKAVDEVIQRHSTGRHLDCGQARRRLRDVGVVLHVLIVDLGNHAGILEKFISGMETLKTTASDILGGCSSAYEVTEKSIRTAVPFHGRISTLLEHISTEEDPHRVSIGKRKLPHKPMPTSKPYSYGVCLSRNVHFTHLISFHLNLPGLSSLSCIQLNWTADVDFVQFSSFQFR